MNCRVFGHIESNSEHRIVYQIFDGNDIMVLEIQSLKGHY